MAYPTTLDSYPALSLVSKLDITGNSLKTLLNSMTVAIVGLETKVGVDGSAFTATVDYKLETHLAAASPHTGHVVIGGQLGGTAASPTILGIRETSGPTSLTIGTITDGQFLKRVGSTLVSAAITGTGDVVGPASVADNSFALFNGTTGTLIKEATPANMSWDNTNKTVNLTALSTSTSCLALKKTEHSSALASTLRVLDSNNRETVGLTSWNGGGGTGGYGSLNLASYCNSSAQRLGEFSFKNSFNTYRLSTILCQTGASNDTGEIVILLGGGAGSFLYSQYLGANGTGFSLSDAPSAKVHIAAGGEDPSQAPLKLEAGLLLLTEEAGTLEYDGTSFYLTPVATRLAIVLTNDSRLTDARNPLAHASEHTLGEPDVIALDTLGPTTDVTALNASISAHGLLPKLSNVATQFLNGVGGWTIPAGTYVHPNHSGDVTSVADGATTIANNAVTNAKAADMATLTIKGNNTGGAADPLDLTAAQTRTLLNVADGATANSSDATLLARANHTGTQLAATISDFSTAVAATAAVTANTAKVTNATHTGEVTGATALTIANDAVTYAKMQNVSAISKLLGRGSAAGAGDPEEITLGTNLSMSGTTINASGGGATATTVETNFGSTAKASGKFTITDAAITGSSKVFCWQSPGPYTGKGTRSDEAEMQPVSVICVTPGAGSAVVTWQTPPLIIMQPDPQQGGGAATSIPKDPQAGARVQAKRIGKVSGNVKFSYMVLS